MPRGATIQFRRSLTSLVLPAYNPGPGIERTLRELTEFTSRSDRSWEVIFVCDGCSDGTANTIRDWNAQHETHWRVIDYSPNRGKGHALRTGLAEARGEWVIFTDVDLAYSCADIDRLADVLHEGASLAIASRTHPDSWMQFPAAIQGYLFRRHMQSSIFSWLVRRLLPLSQRDTQAGLKGFHSSVLEKLLPRLSCDGFGIDCEILTASARWGIPVTEIPVRIEYREAASTTSPKAMYRMLKEVLRIRRDWRKELPLPAEWREQTSYRKAG